MTSPLRPRIAELAQRVLAPLVLGGPILPVRPVGGPLALRLASEAYVADPDIAARLSIARVRRARLVAPIDSLPDLSSHEWALVAALNDLIQVTNHHLSSPMTRGRHRKLLTHLRWLLPAIPPPRDIGSVLARHATFARALEVVRIDSAVSWWTDSTRFRGEAPPRRLLAWPELRRVRVEETRVPLAQMSVGIPHVAKAEYLDVLGAWLMRSPLTDLATLGRAEPAFMWSHATLSLLATAQGRTLAHRALGTITAEVATTLKRATEAIPEGYEEARAIASLAMEWFASAPRSTPGNGAARNPRSPSTSQELPKPPIMSQHGDGNASFS